VTAIGPAADRLRARERYHSQHETTHCTDGACRLRACGAARAEIVRNGRGAAGADSRSHEISGRRGTLPGAVTLVARHGAIVRLDAVGYQNLEDRKPMRTDSIFQIMSMTKPITAVGIMMLMEDGRLALSDPVEKYLPEFRQLRSDYRPITIRDLLTHTAGVNTPEIARNIMSTLDLTLAEAVSYYAQAPLDFEPGSRWNYSNPGFAVLGRIIEVVSRRPYERFIDERILKPLGMRDSFFFRPRTRPAASRWSMRWRTPDCAAPAPRFSEERPTNSARALNTRARNAAVLHRDGRFCISPDDAERRHV